MENVHVLDIGSIYFHGKNYLKMLHSIKNTGKDLTMKQMFDISDKLIAEQSDEIYGVSTINWEHSSWKHLSLVGDEEVVSLSHAKVYVFSDSVLCLGKVSENTASHIVWDDKLTWFVTVHHNTELWTKLTVGQWNSSGMFSQDSPHAALQQSPRVPVKNERRTRIFHRTDHLHVDVQRHLMGTWRQWTGMRMKPQTCFDLCEKIFNRRWSFLGPESEKKWYSTHESKPQGEWERVAELMMIRFGEGRHPVLPIHESIVPRTLKCRGGGKLSINFCAVGWTIETVFRTTTSVNQLSIYGAVSDLCEEYSACQTRTERPVLAGQSDPLFEPAKLLITKPTPSIETPAQEDLLQKYKERVERLSQQNRVLKKLYWFKIPENSWSRTVLHDKALKTSHNLQNWWHVVSTPLPRDEKSSDPKVWIRGNTKIGPVLEVTTSYLQGKYEVEIRTECIHKDNSHS